MRRLLLLLLFSLPAFAQSGSTMCQTVDITVVSNIPERRLIGCGAGYPDNLIWHLDRSDSADGSLDQKWRARLTGRGSVVYLLDSGVLRDHDEFQRPSGNVIIDGIDVASLGCPALAPCARSELEVFVGGHGTATASILAGRRLGVAPDAMIVAVTTVTTSDALWEHALLKVIEHAYKPTTPPFQTAIVSMSFAPRLGNSSPRFEAVMRRMIIGVNAAGESDPNGKKFLFVVFGGNNGPLIDGLRGHCTSGNDVAIFPSMIAHQVDGLIAVGGLTRENTQWSGACNGNAIELLAPAADILTASNTGTDHYRADARVVSGTSYSAPYVAGMAARLLESDPTLTPQQLETLLKASPSTVDGKPVPVMIFEPSVKRRAVR